MAVDSRAVCTTGSSVGGDAKLVAVSSATGCVLELSVTDLMHPAQIKLHVVTQTKRASSFLKLSEEDTAKDCKSSANNATG
ncbi:MAG: hypothetical protein QOI04_480 [Verrucomicrobiota bacterium]|jgi:hypothetical protein